MPEQRALQSAPALLQRSPADLPLPLHPARTPARPRPQDALDEIARQKPKDLFKPLRVHFIGEDGIDAGAPGGLRRAAGRCRWWAGRQGAALSTALCALHTPAGAAVAPLAARLATPPA